MVHAAPLETSPGNDPVGQPRLPHLEAIGTRCAGVVATRSRYAAVSLLMGEWSGTTGWIEAARHKTGGVLRHAEQVYNAGRA